MAQDPVLDHLWQPTIRSLHRWSQVVGKIRLALAESSGRLLTADREKT